MLLELQRIQVPIGQTLILNDVTWPEFERILEELGENRSSRIAYHHGRLEIMSPLLEHESDKEMVGDFVKALLDELARNIVLLEDSNIRTNSDVGNGGNIILTANSIVALNDSDILAFARDGKGGNVTLNTCAFFGQNYRPVLFGIDLATLDGNDRVDINASGSFSSGTITTPDTSFIQNNLNQLPKETIDTTKLLSQTCIVRKDKSNGTFYITGTDGLPIRPSDLSPSQYPTNTIQPTQTATRPWQKGDPIVEPSGFYTLTNGHLIMSRECRS